MQSRKLASCVVFAQLMTWCPLILQFRSTVRKPLLGHHSNGMKLAQSTDLAYKTILKI